MPDFRSRSSGGAVPVTENPMASSPPSLVCPPTSATPSRSRTSSAPAMSCVRSSSIFLSAANGSVTIAHRRQRLGSHREDIAERVIGGDAAE